MRIIEYYGKWLASPKSPRKLFKAEPGSILVVRQREFCRSWPNQREVTVSGIHFIQEDSADEIGRAAHRMGEARNGNRESARYPEFEIVAGPRYPLALPTR